MLSDIEKIKLAQRFLAELGVSQVDLGSTAVVPTISEYLPRVVSAASPAQQDKYGTYWNRAETHFGSRRLDELCVTDVLALQRQSARYARRRANSRNGRHAGEGAVRAMRLLYRLAIADGLIAATANPAAAIPLPRRLPTVRRALTHRELNAISQVVCSSGNDVALDSLLLRLHVETACRRGGALGLSLGDLDAELCGIRLHEKGGTVRWQPVSPTLCAALHAHAIRRGAERPNDPLLRYSNRAALTGRRYDLLWARVRGRLPWAAKLGVSTHWLRHTTLTWVERNYGYAVARAYAGHTDAKGGSTLTYIKGGAPRGHHRTRRRHR